MRLGRAIWTAINAASLLGFVLAVVAGLVSAASTLLLSLPWYGQVVLFVAALLAGTVAALVVGRLGVDTYRDFVSGVPRLRFGRPFEETRTVLFPDTSGLMAATAVSAAGTIVAPIGGFPNSRTEDVLYAYLVVENHAKNKRQDCTAREAVVDAEFIDLLGKPLFDRALRLRWADSPNPAEQAPFSTPSNFDVWQVGVSKPEPVDLVYAIDGNSDFYVYTNESARRGLRDPRTRIAEPEFEVRVRVRGANFSDLTGIFRVSRDGGRITITQV